MKLRKREYVILLLVISLMGYGVFGWAQDMRIIPRLQLGTQCSLAFAASDTTKTCTLGTTFLNTELHSLKLIVPAFSATTPTVTITLKDEAGSTLYSQAAIAENTTTYIPLSRPLTFGSSYVILLSTTAGTGGGTITIDSWVYK